MAGNVCLCCLSVAYQRVSYSVRSRSHQNTPVSRRFPFKADESLHKCFQFNYRRNLDEQALLSSAAEIKKFREECIDHLSARRSILADRFISLGKYSHQIIIICSAFLLSLINNCGYTVKMMISANPMRVPSDCSFGCATAAPRGAQFHTDTMHKSEMKSG